MGEAMSENARWQQKLRDAYRAYPPPKTSRPTSIRLPGISKATGAPHVAFRELRPGTIELAMTADAVCANVQTDHGAFESWAIALKLWLGDQGIERIVLTWRRPDNLSVNGVYTNRGLHYQRFLFRVHSFKEMFDWFEVSADAELEVIASESVTANPLWLNQAGKRRTSTSSPKKRKAEDELEHQLLQSEPFREAMALLPSYPRRQFPVGLFRQEIASNNSRVFTGGKSAIDLVGMDSGGAFVIFELKALKNKPVGALSELLFYTALVREAANATPRFKLSPQNPHALDVRSCAGIRSYLLADNFHPLLERHDLLATLNAGASNVMSQSIPVEFHRVTVDRKQWLRPSP